MILPPASKVSCPVCGPVLVLKFHAVPVLNVMLPVACKRMVEKPANAAVTLIAPPAVEVPRIILAGSRRKVPPLHPDCALASMPEFNDRILGALISTLPPLPPCAPPAAEIRLPTVSLKSFPDCKVTVPPELPPVELSPLAEI